MILGSGSHTYEWLEDWAKIPEGIQLGYTHGVVVDAADNVYVHNQSRDAVIKLDREGAYLASWGEEFASGAHGMFLNREGKGEFLYLADYARHIVAKTTLDGRVLWTIGVPDRPDIYSSSDSYKPTDVAVAPNGDFYVFDGYGQSWIHQYGPNGALIRSWGGTGKEPGQLDCPHGGWVDTRGAQPELLVADRGNNRIQIFTLDGEHKRFVTEELRMPCCFYQFQDEIYVPDLFARVTVLGRDNRLITHLGDNPGIWETQGWPNIPHEMRQAGKFSSPHACCVDSRGDLYVVEWVSDGRITKLRRAR
jgi:DNA-binding beta-propeller fold protein YncE